MFFFSYFFSSSSIQTRSLLCYCLHHIFIWLIVVLSCDNHYFFVSFLFLICVLCFLCDHCSYTCQSDDVDMFCSHLLILFLQSIINQLFLRTTQCERCQSVISFSESHSESVCFIHVYLFFCLINIQLMTSDLLTFYFFIEEAFFYSKH